jgi:hypothetical protein
MSGWPQSCCAMAARHPVRYGAVEQRRILAEVARPPDRARDGTASWSLSTLPG